MTCPSCGGELLPGGERCPVCDAGVELRVDGALAAEPRLVTPPARGRARAEQRTETLRDIPGMRRREKTWRDEVQERVRSRRQKRASAGLPLFDDPAEPAPAAAPAEAPPPAPPVAETVLSPAPPPAGDRPAEPLREPDLASTRLSDAEFADLPLRGEAGDAPEAAASGRAAVPSLDEEVLLDGSFLDAEVELSPPVGEPTPVERPARPLERARAAAVDAALFAALAVVVVYFTGRAARADLPALLAGWPGIASYLGLLALFYAGYFTGTTGQTPGKLMTGLRVVDSAGRPPGYGRAMGRAVVGVLGTLVAGLGLLPMAFDPAARAAHDRLFRTRVVRF
jgi:uncharacterized RDD family membrane protein YckC